MCILYSLNFLYIMYYIIIRRKNMAPRGKCKFTKDLAEEFPFLRENRDDNSKIYCISCKKSFSIQNKGKHDIQQHMQSKTHITSTSMKAKKGIDNYFKNNQITPEEFKLTYIELMWTYHDVKHDHSFRDMDCTSKLLRKCVDRKISCGKTKTRCLVNNVISTWCQNKIKTELETAKYVVIACDASNHKSTKLLPILVRYFKIDTFEVKTCILNIHSLPNETAETVTSVISKDINSYGLNKKVVGFLADNANVNFGSIARQTEKNVHAMLCKTMKRNILPIGCAAHIFHNALGIATNKELPIDIENIIVKIYFHFSIYTVRTEKLKDFCEFVNVQYKTLLSHTKTRWLSLSPGVDRVLLLFDALSSYFLSDENSPQVLVTFFSSETTKFWLLFIQAQLQLFNDSIKKIERSDITAMEVANIYKSLYKKILNRLEDKFIPSDALKLITNIENAGTNKPNLTFIIQKFYSEIIKYFDKWSNRFLEDSFAMKHFLLREHISYEEFISSYEFYNKNIRNSQESNLVPTEGVNSNDLYDSYRVVKGNKIKFS